MMDDAIWVQYNQISLVYDENNDKKNRKKKKISHNKKSFHPKKTVFTTKKNSVDISRIWHLFLD